jgi:hypothetical protein
MFSNLAYVREKLRRTPLKECKAIGKKLRISDGTMKRLKYEPDANPLSETTDRLALYFRTKEKRGSV